MGFSNNTGHVGGVSTLIIFLNKFTSILNLFSLYFVTEFFVCSMNCNAILSSLSLSDMIAIPDFAAGAMENWGLITYRETAMLYEPGVSSEGNKQRVTVVITHELAHQVPENFKIIFNTFLFKNWIHKHN